MQHQPIDYDAYDTFFMILSTSNDAMVRQSIDSTRCLNSNPLIAGGTGDADDADTVWNEVTGLIY